MADPSTTEGRSLYHRWRSRDFSELVAQEHVTRTLKNAIAGGKLVHAYLFCGPRGTGKTSTARILAKAANCLDPQQGEPCNRCSSCVSMNQGRAIDLIEIDAASNRGIDDARDLREKIKFSPAESKYKIYIIDEAHMLTSEASNALLKTLEEPPAHAILILATTEAHKILPTIASRCQRFDFRRIPQQAIVDQLEMICRKEGLGVEQAALDRVARMARGSLRDAESLLDQLVAYCGSRIDLKAAREVLGLTGEDMVPDFADALRRADLVGGFRLIDRVASAGADLRHFSRELLDHLRALMVVKSGADTTMTREFRPEELARLRAAADGWEYRQLLVALRAFGELEGQLKVEAFNQLQLEMAFLEVALAARGSGLERSASLPAGGLESPPSVLMARPSAVSNDTQAATEGVGHESGPENAEAGDGSACGQQAGAAEVAGVRPGATPATPTEESPEPGEPAVTAPAVVESTPALDLPTVKERWPRILESLGAAGMGWRSCRPWAVERDSVVLGVEKESAGMRSLERPTIRGPVEEALSKVFGTRVFVRLKFGVKFSREATASGRDAVVEAAVREFGFIISRVEQD